MTDTTSKVREHYRATGLIERIKPALSTIAPDGETLTVSQLAPLDQFHLGTRLHSPRPPTLRFGVPGESALTCQRAAATKALNVGVSPSILRDESLSPFGPKSRKSLAKVRLPQSFLPKFRLPVLTFR